MAKEKKDKNFIHKPIYEGGPKAMKAFVAENLRYPAEALEKSIEGTVVVQYDINYQGKVVDARVVSGLGHGCDEEALRVVRQFRFKVPRTRGVKVLFHKSINIHFRLPKRKVTRPPKQKITYTYVEKTETTEKENQTEGYSYTINF